jgi:tetratricopeptide (TPR) repeat protein
MAVKKVEPTVTQVEEHQVIRKAMSVWEQYNKLIIYGCSAVILLIAGWYGYNTYIKLPAEQKANDAVFSVQKSYKDFAEAKVDSVRAQLAQFTLNGDGGSNIGALKMISKYSGTDASNLCHFYAGACYLYLKQFDNCIKQLKSYSSSATQLQSHAYGMMGDAYSELKKNDDAMEYYKKAAELNEKDEYTSSEFLFKAGIFAEAIGKKKEALECFKKIKEKYPTTEKGNDIDRYLAKLGEVNE